MAQVIYAAGALADLERLSRFAQEWDEEVAALVIEAVEVLARHPLIGREVEHGLRELVISRGRTGYLALYRFREEHDTVLVLALRYQRQLDGA